MTKTDPGPTPPPNSRPVALITGGSRGIGAATARRLAAEGFDIALSYASREDAARAVLADVEAAGARGLAHKGDLGDPAAVLALFHAVDGAFGRLDVLVNNAGVTAPPGPLIDAEIDDLSRLFDVNILGAFVAAREAGRRMARGRGGAGGVIVNISSVAARLGSPNEFIHYGASKAALDVLTRALAVELGPEGVRVAGVAPGTTLTDIHAERGQHDKPAQVAARTPLRRNGTAEDMANAVAWLVSDEAPFVSGTTITVSGGL
ncbi:SDR family oxidoreductase [Marivibrio halodurans]|uniref:SDR family oxidoreductase n=1 Tax=Marivibrio halodurans TaxID=2039722 RepID=A0A8J7V3U1_9PROT|nr:SDR family oxidoreductase [Marivibrio halodurans]MBP5858750.1 SDR family oxidoreductase [Marivibrio halodurans]